MVHMLEETGGITEFEANFRSSFQKNRWLLLDSTSRAFPSQLSSLVFWPLGVTARQLQAAKQSCRGLTGAMQGTCTKQLSNAHGLGCLFSFSRFAPQLYANEKQSGE